MRQRKEIDWETVDALRERGVKWSEIAGTLNIPRGTLTAADARRRRAEDGKEEPRAVAVATAKEDNRPGLDAFSPREMINHLYKLGYRIEDNGLYVITKQRVKLGDIING